MLQQVCADGATTPGVDLYHGNLIEDINAVIGTGIQYAFLKAWENHIDPTFRERWESMRNHGIIRGAYDFFHPAHDPIEQAQSFLATMDSSLPGDLPMTLDWEVNDGVGAAVDSANALKWLEYVEAKTGKTPILYMSPATMPIDSRFDRFPLWVANYGVTCPHMPPGRTRWEFWQSSSDQLMPGMRAHTDRDVFNGDLDALKAFIVNSKVAV